MLFSIKYYKNRKGETLKSFGSCGKRKVTAIYLGPKNIEY